MAVGVKVTVGVAVAVLVDVGLVVGIAVGVAVGCGVVVGWEVGVSGGAPVTTAIAGTLSRLSTRASGSPDKPWSTTSLPPQAVRAVITSITITANASGHTGIKGWLGCLRIGYT